MCPREECAALKKIFPPPFFLKSKDSPPVDSARMTFAECLPPVFAFRPRRPSRAVRAEKNRRGILARANVRGETFRARAIA